MIRLFLLLIVIASWSVFSARKIAVATAAKAASERCVNIYFDQVGKDVDWMGRTYATMTQNLLGHFPEYQQKVSAISEYRPGEIETCEASIYIGSYFDAPIPKAFLDDFKNTNRRVAWLGYNIWKYSPEEMQTLFGYVYDGQSVLDNDHLSQGLPTFFKDIIYKGETFPKYGKFSKEDPKKFLAAFEMTKLVPPTPKDNSVPLEKPADVEVLAEARHNGTGEQLPYAIRKHNKFYVADVPFSFMHEADRYFVFADLLFDILNAAPRHAEKYALVRIEDIHPLVPLPYIYRMTEALESEHVPIHISLIPIFYDPLNEFGRAPNQELVTLNQVPAFGQFLKEMKAKNAVFVWHGSTHQYLRTRNPHSGVSGDDFEFWDAVTLKPLAADSADMVLGRLDAGFKDLAAAGIYPKFWLTPHYQASALDYSIFARVFPWNVGRVIYFNMDPSTPREEPAAESLWYDETNAKNQSEASRRRHDYFAEGAPRVAGPHWSGQMFPYEIFGDVYGQKIIPENLGNSQPVQNEHVVQPRSVQEMVADAKRNLVLRDSWASFFYHAQLLNTDAEGGRGHYPGDPEELLYLVREIKKLGYTFISADDFASENATPYRPQPTYRFRESQP